MVGKRRGRHGTQGRRLGNGRCLRPGPPGDDPEADGLDFDKTTAEGKLISALLDLTSELCDAVNELDERANTLNDYIEEIDEDLGAVEEYLLDELEEDDDDCDCCDCCDNDCDDCDCCDCEDDDEDEDYEEYGDYYEVVCPGCGEVICFDESIDPENLTCPACNEKFACLCEEDDYKQLDGEEE